MRAGGVGLRKHDREHPVSQMGDEVRRADPFADQHRALPNPLLSRRAVGNQHRHAQRPPVPLASRQLMPQPVEQTASVEHSGLRVASGFPQQRGAALQLLLSVAKLDRPLGPAQQLQRLEGLAHVIHRSEVERAHLVGHALMRGEENHRDVGGIPVILLSAHQGVADKVRALNLGAVDYMSKPFQALELLGRAERAIELCNTQKELQRSTALLRKTGSDPETGMFDRTGLLNRLGHELSRSQRYRRPLSMAVFVPNGVVAQDRVRECAMLIRERNPTPDFIAHLRDGRLAGLLPEANAAGAHGICSRLTTELQDATGLTFRTSSADVGRDGPKPETLLQELLVAVRS